ncbi:MAG: hypothetical protein OEW39_13160, partial [Deltaproteobacteria bacterium]|nr:hypothetical protein [Deltaproteobacteria bacterium]
MTRSLPAPIRRTRLHPAAALLLSLEFAALTLLGHSTEALAFLAALAAVFGLSAGTLRARLGVVLLLLAGTWGVTLTQALFYGGTPRTVLLTLLPPSVFPWGEPPGLHLYAEG